ncbi:MAG TPA: protein kinase [Solirubrobacteraceae bacterium]|jgi:serine/threonine-protein kinase|nr:protein kinase [Solirubrobacteraceae bacterium]
MSLSAAGPRTPDLTGRALDGRYELHRLLGEGTFGRVYRGFDRRLARAVAVKVIKPWWAEDPDWVRRFEREAQLMASVSDPRLVQIFDVCHSEQALYYVAELVVGQNIDARLRAGKMPLEEARQVAEQLGRALGSAHAGRIVHGDIKPANVLISRDGTVKVTDFGLARLVGGTSAQLSATIAGTPTYMAPEQARGSTTPASDVYSAGVVLYEMLAGRPPFDGDTPVELALQHLQDPPPSLDADVPDALRDVVLRALAKDPGDRYRDGDELAEALTENRASGPPRTGHVSAEPVERPRPARVRTLVAAPWSARQRIDVSSRRRTLAAFGVVLAVLIGMLLAVLLTGSTQVRMPDLRGLTQTGVSARLARAHLRARTVHHYSSSRAGIVVGQRPAPGSRVDTGTRVRVTVSTGPPPVAVPKVGGFSASDAENLIRQLGLAARVVPVPAFGAAVGSVIRQSPAPEVKLQHGGLVTLNVAEAPRWRSVSSFDGRASAPFQIRGRRWRVAYRMAYSGTCTFIFFCSGPTARVRSLSAGSQVRSFSLNSGGGQTQVFDTGPGHYQVSVAPGDDSARWSVQVQDYY